MDKLEAGRRQLGAATYLFLHNFDPVAVHCLACSGRNVLTDLVEGRGNSQSYRNLLLEEQPGLNVKAESNAVWNALKHGDQPARAKFDEALLASFTDASNDLQLFYGWFSYSQLTGKLPIAAQVLQVWHIAVHRPWAEDADVYGAADHLFPAIGSAPRHEQKRRLAHVIKTHEQDEEMRADNGTEDRPLTVRAY